MINAGIAAKSRKMREHRMCEAMKTKAGPPVCETCGSIKVAWTHKFKKDNSLLWICPNFCEFHKHGGT